ncbi:MAG TPA: hypothetical protein VJW23_10120 [Propionibacteriaceae bacterium]|nr:hypothetical protein [Propionibacteriaceae bacterium]
MSNARGKHKSRGKRRTKKVSQGLRVGSRSISLRVQLAVLGKGQVDSIKEVEVRQTFGRWMSDRQRVILGER